MEIRVSVRQLVEFILRGGSIDNRRTGGADTAMQEGSRIHRMIQRRMGSGYRAEVGLSYRWVTPDYDIIIEGRADGIIDDGHKVTVDEIKGTYRDLKRIAEPVSVHLSQAKCYAFMYAQERQLENIGVRMTYCNIETEEIKYFYEDYTFDAIKCWFDGIMQEYKKWADFQSEWNAIRTESIKSLQFPFPYREGQKELVTYVYRTIYHKRKLFLEAPTGVGKTVSTVFPAVKAMGEGMAEKLFYLTAKTITRTVAQECFGLLCENGLRMKTIVLTAKDKICFLDEAECNPVACPYADGHFDRVNDAMYDLLTHENHFAREKLTEYAEKHRVCPFEFGLDMSLFSDAVICDYNYVFDPRAYLKRFFADVTAGKRNFIFLVDEAHNLLERGREMYSACLTKESFLQARRLMRIVSQKTARLFDRCNRELLVMKRECAEWRKEEHIDGFVTALNRLYGALDDFLDRHETFPHRKEILEFYFEVAHFLNIYEIMDGNYVAYSRFLEGGAFMLKLFCVNPAVNLRRCMDKVRSTVLFSATLLPIQYYKKLLGGVAEDYEVYAKSTFDSRKRALLIANDVTSRYSRRSEDEYGRIARYIYEVVRQRRGNYMVFLPSHLFLEQIHGCFMREYYDAGSMECLVQGSRMGEEEREQFLSRFQRGGEATLIGFCVMGGIFSEGIDLKRDSLIGAVIVGTGIPQVGCERQILKEHFDEQGENGFDYAYRYPGMNKVLQSAGRVIRTAEDVGVVALLDERFLELQYRRIFPREWDRYEVVDVRGISKSVEKFWSIHSI